MVLLVLEILRLQQLQAAQVVLYPLTILQLLLVPVVPVVRLAQDPLLDLGYLRDPDFPVALMVLLVRVLLEVQLGPNHRYHPQTLWVLVTRPVRLVLLLQVVQLVRVVLDSLLVLRIPFLQPDP